MNRFQILVLGPKGSGKTVLLASMYQKLSTQGKGGFSLTVEDAQRTKLNQIYAQITTTGSGSEWPPGTDRAEISEWIFNCFVQRNGIRYKGCEFLYLDYAGGRINEADLASDSNFSRCLRSADILLGLLDGEKICALIKGETEWLFRDFKNILDVIAISANIPVHFVVSKWDVVESSGYSLKQVRDKLLEYEPFENVVQNLKDAGTDARLIPVSSVGQGFAKPIFGGMEKIQGKSPKPYQIEVPLACVLPDIIRKSAISEIKRKEEMERNKNTRVTASFTDAEERAQNLRAGKGGGFLGFWNWPIVNDIAKSRTEEAARSAQEKKRDAEKRSEELRQQQQAALGRIADEKSALESLINSFRLIQNKLYQDFPESDLTS